ncbi:Protein/nucleic acid deglycase 3 [anaerobic digester metagenome]|nr:DJ-1/PfpI family protein [Clostridiaceae bacterium HFYG-1003]
MKKVACFFADGSEELELIAVVDVLRRGGVKADLISISGPMPVSAHGISIKADYQMDAIQIEDYDAIFIPGGSKGAENLSNHPEVLKAIRLFHTQAKLVSAICAGPVVLEKAGILAGHHGTSYPGFEGELSFKVYEEKLVVASEGVVTSRGPATALLLGFELLRQLDLTEDAQRIWKGMLMPQLAQSIKDPEIRS